MPLETLETLQWLGSKDDEKLELMFEVWAKDIVKQQKRIGGDWSIAFVLSSKKIRDILRKTLGSEIVFIMLQLPKEHYMKRFSKRHGEGGKALVEAIYKMNILIEPVEPDEENAYNINITEDMSPNDVVQEVLSVVENSSSIK